KGLGGIFPDPEQPGFKHTILRPNFVDGLTNFEAKFKSPDGEISSKWEIKKKNVTYEIVIPANSSATLYLPDNISGEKIRQLDAGKHILKLNKTK
ncbi:MAG: alpha-rhamnosidase, partial [Prevotella sp.]|nr:alpha-rhamnosidase [Prevotella sp.]